MRVLFVGSEEKSATSIQSRENGEPFSLFFYPSLFEALEHDDSDAVVIPAARFLSGPCLERYVPLIASGKAELAEDCFEAGCSDFIREPWTEDELHARISHHASSARAFNHYGLRIVGHTLIGPAAKVALSADACNILLLLAANAGQPVPKMAIASLIGVRASNSRSIDMRMARIRTSLRSAGAGFMADRLRGTHGAYQLCT